MILLLLVKLFVQILIIAALVIIFLLVTILNMKVKAPKDAKIPEKCISCTSTSCMIKLKDVEKIKKELREELEKCENKEEDNHEQQ